MQEPSMGELLSALMDDELNEVDRELVVKALCEHPELMAKWARLHLVSQIVQEGPITTANLPKHKLSTQLAKIVTKISEQQSKKTDKV